MTAAAALLASATIHPADAPPIPWHETLVVATVEFGIWTLVAGMLICIHRLLRGPHLADRAVAIDTMAVQLIGLVLLISIRLGTLVFFDGILVMSLLGFAGTVAIAQYIARPHTLTLTRALNGKSTRT